MNHVLEPLIPVFFFLMIAGIVIVPQYLRYKDRARLHETLRQAVDKGQPLPPEVVGALTARAGRVDADALTVYPPTERADRDLRRGLVWLAIGAGMILIGAAWYAALYDYGGAPQTFAGFASIGAIPACIGVAFLFLWRFGRRDKV